MQRPASPSPRQEALGRAGWLSPSSCPGQGSLGQEGLHPTSLPRSAEAASRALTGDPVRTQQAPHARRPAGQGRAWTHVGTHFLLFLLWRVCPALSDVSIRGRGMVGGEGPDCACRGHPFLARWVLDRGEHSSPVSAGGPGAGLAAVTLMCPLVTSFRDPRNRQVSALL